MAQQLRYVALILLTCALTCTTAVASLYGEHIPTEQAAVVYIIDCSCSMDSGWSTYIGPDGQEVEGYRMSRAIAEMTSSVDKLPPVYWFDVVSTDHPGYALFGELTESTDENKGAATGHIHTLHGGGETGLAPATEWALSAYEYHDVFDYYIVTGGVPTCCIEDSYAYWEEVADRIRGANERNARIHVIVIWPDPEDPILDFAETITAETGGTLTVLE